jgi:hypothetical protein
MHAAAVMRTGGGAARGVDPSAASVADVRSFIDAQSLPSTALRYARLLDRLYGEAAESGLVRYNPLTDLKETLSGVEPRRRTAALFFGSGWWLE